MNPDDLNLARLCNCKLFSSPRAIPVSLMNLRPDRSRWGLKPISQTRGSPGTQFTTRCHSVSCLGIHYQRLLSFALQMSSPFFSWFFFFVCFLTDFLDSAQHRREQPHAGGAAEPRQLCGHGRSLLKPWVAAIEQNS